MLWLHNLKKSKGQYLSFGIMICLTAFIMNIALTLAFQTSDAYDARLRELDTADVNILIPSIADNDDIRGDLEKISGISLAEKHEGIFLPVTVRDFADSDFDMNTVFYCLSDERSLNRLEVKGDNVDNENTVYLPFYITDLGGFAQGETVTYSYDGEDCTYTIGGTVSEMQYGNYGTGLIGGYFPRSAYDAFEEKHESAKVSEYSLKLDSNADIPEIKTAVTEYFSDKGIPVVSMGDRISCKQTRTMVCDLLIVIFLALAAIILLVSVFLSNFRIRNTIDEEMTDMGVLKALGYTSAMIISSAVIPYTLTGTVSALIGAFLSQSIIPRTANVLAVQSGFEFTPVFDIAALLGSCLIPVVIILIFSIIAAGKIKNTQPINAIRGITGGAADKNRIPMDTTSGSVGVLLVVKQIVSQTGQNILLFAVSFGIMILLSFAGTLLYNVTIKPDNFMNTLSEETPSVIYTAKEGKLSELKDKLSADPHTERVIEYAALQASYEDGSLTAFVCEDFSKVTNDICYEGRNPETENEIAVGNALAEKYPIGSEIELKMGEKSETFKVTGYVQSVNNSGNVCELTKDGCARISDKEINTLNLYLKDVSAEDYINANDFDELAVSSQNYEQLAENGRKLYASIVSAAAAVIFIISVLIVLLVMYIIISSMLTKRRQEFGIYKAIGWSSARLTVQSAMGFVPVIGVSAVLSAIAGLRLMPAADNMIFGMIGAVKNHFEVPLWILLVFAAALTVASFIISVLLAAPIKKITAYSLLKE